MTGPVAMIAALAAWGWFAGLGVVIVVVVSGVLLSRRNGTSTKEPSDPMRCLEVQRARGEISNEKYHRLRSQLVVEHPSGRYYDRGSDESRA